MTAYLRGDDKKDLTPYKNFLKQTGKKLGRQVITYGGNTLSLSINNINHK